MKKVTIILACLFVTVIAGNSIAQEKKEKHEIRKEVRMEDENGKKVLTIITTENGKVTEEVYEGSAADEKLKEFQRNDKVELKEERQEVKVEVIKGKTTLTITTTSGTNVNEEVYVGEEAENKIKEMGLSDGKMKRVEKEVDIEE